LEHFLKQGRREGRKAFVRYTPGGGKKARPGAGKAGDSWSQLGQDLWVIRQSGFKTGGYFVEIGATDGIKLSNTYLLEKRYGWKGVCVEPDPVAFADLTRNRTAFCTTSCIWSESGETLDFILAKVNGAVVKVADRDHHAPKRKAFETMGQTIQVKTLSLNDLLAQAGAPAAIDYISIDTEGAEYEILSTFDFSRWKVALWTIEHNYTAQRERIYDLMTSHGYERLKVKFDDWYFLPGVEPVSRV
jgi:FkbM family methyltransferase